MIIPEIIRPAGYFTAMTGKWHLDKEPTEFGFERYFGHLSGACNYYRGDKTFRLNGEPWSVPDKGFYTTVANVDFALDFLKEAREAKKPWFLYLAFNAPHAPLQPLEKDYKQNQFEGGICTPAIVHWPAGIRTARGAISDQPAHLVDLLPTIAELAGATAPASWPGRSPSALAGTSLVSVLKGEQLLQRPPIHLLFNQDRGLRDGDWKLVSFQSQPWELYNIAADRTELNNLASKYPERVAAMAKQWHAMTADELMAPEKERMPVADHAEGVHSHREWSVYSGKNGAVTSKQGPAEGSAESQPVGIRARKDTKLKIKGQELILTCRTGDPGIALDHLKLPDSKGPYVLAFDLNSSAGGKGELYFTTDAETALPQGSHLEFDVIHDEKWHAMALDLKTGKAIHAIRLDTCTEAGKVRIRKLRVQDAEGKVIQNWP